MSRSGEPYKDEAARLAEHMEIIEAPDGSGERHLMVDSALVGKMIYDETDCTWVAYALLDGELVHAVEWSWGVEREDVEDADRWAVGFVADLVAARKFDET